MEEVSALQDGAGVADNNKKGRANHNHDRKRKGGGERERERERDACQEGKECETPSRHHVGW